MSPFSLAVVILFLASQRCSIRRPISPLTKPISFLIIRRQVKQRWVRGSNVTRTRSLKCGSVILACMRVSLYIAHLRCRIGTWVRKVLPTPPVAPPLRSFVFFIRLIAPFFYCLLKLLHRRIYERKTCTFRSGVKRACLIFIKMLCTLPPK